MRKRPIQTQEEPVTYLPRPERRSDARYYGFLIGVLLTMLVISNLDIISPFFGTLDPFLKYRQENTVLKQEIIDYQEQEALLRRDRDMLKDTSNVLLALQEYYYDYGRFPDSLQILSSQGYVQSFDLLTNIFDGAFWYYTGRGSDFVFCAYLSDETRGVNTGSCPKKDSF